MKIKTAKMHTISKISFIVLIIAFIAGYFLYIRPNKIPPLNIPKPGNEIPEIDYKVTAKFDNLPTEAMVYRFIKPKNIDIEIKSLAKIFGLKGEMEYQPIWRTYLIKEKIDEKYYRALEYEIDTGRWHYEDSKGLDNDDPQNLPSDEEAKKIALDFLKKNGLYDKRFIYCAVTDSSSGDKITNDYKVHHKNVYFYPEIKGKPVYGVSRILVVVGDNGKIVEVYKWYKEIEEYKKVKIISAEKAFEKVKNRKSSNSINHKAKSATIKEVFLAYWEDAGTIEEQPYLQPVWVFAGEAVTEDGKVEKFDAVVPAIE
ncbi:hypothetical protein B0S90_1231 [Caldicellulosiruptor bescii]|uniref:Uncharacterized protein n=2 Tax=Caldicellulosiruptor bescii TaxID=31899 RepID=B9MQU4_CALBD|nr:hypothetical protein [Caldicellulosiruptor bescii]ACM60048.1 conserved hypothetical protein [Caldicellulosiruptor bescii DSM 6725]PBC87461.1 hypothetical protein B0S87_0371 [Caldicellulosiruptor bescii]PBC90394.1 hypothetical protein B0S89_0733 [Caldicellulosiruptor bescii]PBD04174.1 hypothetical protein B0S85_1806 [Caldicellulosiruptor bescii]PBD06191.1 hypothetical protein B0S90_1231 [Caldicellulosiruptor bescii]